MTATLLIKRVVISVFRKKLLYIMWFRQLDMFRLVFSGIHIRMYMSLWKPYRVKSYLITMLRIRGLYLLLSTCVFNNIGIVCDRIFADRTSSPNRRIVSRKVRDVRGWRPTTNGPTTGVFSRTKVMHIMREQNTIIWSHAHIYICDCTRYCVGFSGR